MRFHALACDFDGTLASGGRVDDYTVAALERLSRTGRRLILVTGRRLEELAAAFDRLDLFDVVVAENGGVLHRPAERETRTLAQAPPEDFARRLREEGVEPLETGEVIVATVEPHHTVALEAVRELGLDLQVIFNKGAVMVLPAGVTKGTGLAEAAAELGLSPHSIVGVGDAENDHAFLSMCECAVAVAGALPAVKERCDLVTSKDEGGGVAELVERLVDDDLSGVPLDRHHILLGSVAGDSAGDSAGDRAGDSGDGAGDGEEVRLSPYGTRLLIAGPSHSGKSTVTGALLERIGTAGYQFCLIDPEGDYADGLKGALVLGDARRAPVVEEVAKALGDPGLSVVVNLLGVRLDDRPGFFEDLLPRIAASRSAKGTPHWVVVDEAHHLMPTGFALENASGLADSGSLLMVTVHPEAVSEEVRKILTGVIAIGDRPGQVLDGLARSLGVEAPGGEWDALPTGELVIWQPSEGPPVHAVLAPPEGERHRHRRKYAAGSLGEEESFRFRGPGGRLDLPADNLTLFLRIGDGVDEETWLHHLRAGDYSAWIATCVKDQELADLVAEVERDCRDSAQDGRRRIRELIEERYTAPAEPYDPG
ncbi:HAD family hydrolase [Microbispora sp. NPDC049125]|uniref:HAD family hydrolase n=1 Tax=Microbispora sp. NPDC049125 TaxID=3154929 RepID=UPI00346584FB